MDLSSFDLSRFSYDRESGTIFSHGRKVGYLNRSLGYLFVSLDHHVAVTAHRLAYFLSVGKQPPRVDHINGDKTDNRWLNLRAASVRQNAYNSRRRADNTSGFKGVSWSSHKGKWRACLKLPDGRQKHVGFFSSASAAHHAWLSAAKTIHGEFLNAG